MLRIASGIAFCCVALSSHGHDMNAAMADQGKALVNAVDAIPKVIKPGQLHYDLDDNERFNLDFVPNAMQAARGVPLGVMPLPARLAAHALLREVLSDSGYLLVNHIMLMDDVLRHSETWSAARLSDDYRFEVYGTPSADSPWAWKVEGHHVSVNVTAVDGEVRATPLFLGTNPVLVASGPRTGFRLMVPHETIGQALLASLSAAQLKSAYSADDPGRGGIQRGPRQAQQPRGVSASTFDAAQRNLIDTLLETWIRSLDPHLAVKELEEIRAAGLENLTFEWRGSKDPTRRHYWAVRGPNVVIEFDQLPNAGSETVNHIHSVWSNPQRDYGVDLLQRHYEQNH